MQALLDGSLRVSTAECLRCCKNKFCSKSALGFELFTTINFKAMVLKKHCNVTKYYTAFYSTKMKNVRQALSQGHSPTLSVRAADRPSSSTDPAAEGS